MNTNVMLYLLGNLMLLFNFIGFSVTVFLMKLHLREMLIFTRELLQTNIKVLEEKSN